MCCRKVFHTPEPKSSLWSAVAATPRTQKVRGLGGPAMVGVRVDVAKMQAAPPPLPPSPTHSASSAVVSSPPFPESQETVQQEGRRSEGQGRKGEATARTEEGGDKGGQAAAGGEGAELAAAGAGKKAEERGETAAAKLPADPFNLAESDRLGGAVVADILVVSDNEGKGARRMEAEGGQRQLTAVNMPAAAMKSISAEVRMKEEGKGRRGPTGTGAAEGGDSGVRTGGEGQTYKGGKVQVGASVAKQAAGNQEGKGEKEEDRGNNRRSRSTRSVVAL